MAIINPVTGKIRGKIAGMVYALNRGVNVVRELNPAPFNPSTQAQVDARAKLKLLSQASAVVAPILAMPRSGMMTQRNHFTKVNYKYTEVANTIARIVLADMQFTASDTGFPGFKAQRIPGYGISVELLQNAVPAFDKCVWITLRILETGKFMVAESKVVDLTDALPLGQTIMQNIAGDCTVHCYGISLKSASAKAYFENTVVAKAEQVAQLVSNNVFNESEFAFSETRGLYLREADEIKVTSGTPITVELSSNVEGATLVGDGQYTFGQQVTLQATAPEGYHFSAWYNVYPWQYVSGQNPYTFSLGSQNVKLRAYFEQNT